MTTSTINPAIPATGSALASAPIRAQFQAAINDINALWTASAANTAAAATAQSTANTALTNAAAALAAATTANSGWTRVSTYGNPTGSNDTTIIQAAFTAAINSNRKLLFDVPVGWPSAQVDWFLASAPSDSNGALQAPQVTTFDASTGLVTFDRNHNLNTGDVIQFVGSPGVGSGGGLTQVVSYTEYFVNKQGTTTLFVYDTQAHALAAGATGKYIPTTGITTTGTINALTTAVDMLNGATSVTVTDAAKIIIGDQLNFVGSGGGTYYTATNVNTGTDVITFTPAYSGSTVASGSTVWPTSVDVASTLSLENGSTITFSGPGTQNNFFGSFVVTSIVGSTLHLDKPPNANLPTPGATQTVKLGLWADPEYLNLKFEISGSPGVILKKTLSFSGNEMLHFFYGSQVYLHDIEMWGKTYGYHADPAIVNGDDGFRNLAAAGTTVERVIMKYFGDSAIRLNTSTFWVGAKSTTFPDAGVYSQDIVIKDSKFIDVFQLSTTASGANYQGGAKNFWYINNQFKNIGGSVKLANRAPGGSNMYLTGNHIIRSGRHGFELDSYDNFVITGNIFENIHNYPIYIIANDLQPIGFEFNNLTIEGNTLIGGADTLASTASGGIFINPDLYPDGTRWDYKGLNITNNTIQNLPASTYPINIAGGSYQGAIIANNNINNCAGTVTIRMTPRCSATTGLNNNMLITGNVVTKTSGTKCTFIDLVPSNGAAGVYYRGVTVSNNQFDNSDASLGSNVANDAYFFHADYVQDTHIINNWWRGFGGTAVYIQTEGNNLTIQGNDFNNGNTVAGSIIAINNVNGIRMNDNKIVNGYSGTSAINLDRQCQAVRMFGNDLTGSANATMSVGNVPIKTSPDGQRRIDYLAAATVPTSGTWNVNDQVWTTTPTSGAAPGGVCTVAGSYSAITATATSDGSTAVLTSLSNFTNISVGTYFTHPGFSGTVRVISMTATTITVSANSNSPQVAQAITVANGTFKNMANLA